MRQGAWRGVGAVLAAALAAAAAGCAGRGRGDVAAVVRGSDLRCLPAGTAGLAVVEVARFKDRQAVGRWLDDFMKEYGPDAGLEGIRRALGPAIGDRLRRVALAVVPSGGATGYAVLVEGTFDAAMASSLTGGREILTLVEMSGRPDLSVTALEDHDLVFGPRAVLEEVRAAALRPEAGLGRSRLLPVLATISPDHEAWGAIDYALLADLLKTASPGGDAKAASLLPAGRLRAVAFQGAVDASVTFDLVGLADAEAGAKQLADAARGLVALARMGASQSQKKDWLEFLDSVRIEQSDATVRLHGVAAGGFLRALAPPAPAPTPPAPARPAPPTAR